MIIDFFFQFFAYFSKTIDFGSVFSAEIRNEFCMQKYPNKHNLIGFENNSHLLLNFC